MLCNSNSKYINFSSYIKILRKSKVKILILFHLASFVSCAITPSLSRSIHLYETVGSDQRFSFNLCEIST